MLSVASNLSIQMQRMLRLLVMLSLRLLTTAGLSRHTVILQPGKIFEDCLLLFNIKRYAQP